MSILIYLFCAWFLWIAWEILALHRAGRGAHSVARRGGQGDCPPYQEKFWPGSSSPGSTPLRGSMLRWKIVKRLTWCVKCSWCGRTMKHPWLPIRLKISHTICQRCFDTETRSILCSPRGASLDVNHKPKDPACRGDTGPKCPRPKRKCFSPASSVISWPRARSKT